MNDTGAHHELLPPSQVDNTLEDLNARLGATTLSWEGIKKALQSAIRFSEETVAQYPDCTSAWSTIEVLEELIEEFDFEGLI